MASKKDMRRADLLVPRVSNKDEDKTPEFAGTMTSTLPMAAIFTRNKMIGWVAVLFAVQNWLSESPNSKSATPGILGVTMSLLSLAVSYMGLFMPPPPAPKFSGTTTDAPAAAPIP